jgi:hypothetical protein
VKANDKLKIWQNLRKNLSGCVLQDSVFEDVNIVNICAKLRH